MREYRIRYELETASGRNIIHAVIVEPKDVKTYMDKVNAAGYRLVGIDRRVKGEERMELNEGWTVIKNYIL